MRTAVGVSSGDDKLVQEVVRIILEQIYEPIFHDCSHGFRPGRSPHTALEHIKQEWTAVKWLVDMDLQSYFDTIPHDVLVALLEKKIEDRRFIRLIKAMLEAGFLEDWTYHTTYSGVPQGSIVSPILANVVLHELDLFMETLKKQFDAGKRRKGNNNYIRYSNKIRHLRKKYDTLKRKGETRKNFRKLNELSSKSGSNGGNYQAATRLIRDTNGSTTHGMQMTLRSVLSAQKRMQKPLSSR